MVLMALVTTLATGPLIDLVGGGLRRRAPAAGALRARPAPR
jgi:hypothetical protein